jgi:serine protease Do
MLAKRKEPYSFSMGEKPRKRRVRIPIDKTAAVTMVAILAGAGGLSWAMSGGPAAAPSEPIRTEAVQTEQRSGDLADLIAAVKPAVVNISVTGHQAVASGSVPTPQFRAPPGAPFGKFFRKHFGQPPAAGTPHSHAREFKAVGSGFIISADGYVVTNHHVIRQAEQINVILDDGSSYRASIQGRDPKTDLALLKIKPNKPLPFIEFGDSKQARVGDRIVAIGNPFGLGGSATTGIISARGRDIQSGPFDDFIQIDAPINQGNSGGPLFDMNGRVIGINTAIFSPNGGNVGIGFAIPSSQARTVIAQLRSNGHVERGWLGVQIQLLTRELADSMDLPSEQGALVASVAPRSPAARAGVRSGDVILSFNGRKVMRMKDLPRLVAQAGSDQTISMDVWRDGKKRHLNVVIGTAPETIKQAAYQPRSGDGNEGKLGLALAPLTDENRRQFGVDDTLKHGAVIVDVRNGSPAAEKGLRPGDVIIRVGQSDVSDPQHVVDAVKRASGGRGAKLLLLVNRQGAAQFIAMDLA